MSDIINAPSHYTHGGIETIDFIEAKGLDRNHYLACVVKYVSRWEHKGGLEDLQKAHWYLERAIAQAQRRQEEEQSSRKILDEQQKRLAKLNAQAGVTHA